MNCEGVRMLLTGLFIGVILQSSVNGLVEIKSSTEEIADNFCADHVTFICNAQQFESFIIHFFINNVSFVNYSYISSQVFPINISTPLTGAFVQIQDANFISGTFNFRNFTLTIDLLSLLELEGKSIYCGTSLDRSESISTAIDSNLDVNYTAVYGFKDELTAINVSWKDLLKMDLCKVRSIYEVQLKNSEGTLLKENTTKEDCTNKICFVVFEEFNITSTSYYVQINYINSISNVTDSFISQSISRGYNISSVMDFTNCSLSLTCSEFASTNCTVTFDSNQTTIPPRTISPNSTDIVAFNNPREYFDIAILTQIGSYGIVHTLQNLAGTVNVYTTTGGIKGLGIAMLILGIFILISGYVCGIILICKKQISMGYLCVISLIWSIIPLITWISAVVLFVLGSSNEVSCNAENSMQNPYNLAATILSLILPVISIPVVGGFILSSKWKITIVNSAPVPIIKKVQFDDQYLVRFPNDEVQRQESEKCAVCEKKFTENIKNPKDVIVAVASGINYSVTCWGCGKLFCEECSLKHKAYIPCHDQFEGVCRECYDDFKQEISRLSQLHPVGKEYPLPQGSQECMLCHKNPETGSDKNDKIDVNETKSVNCCSCGWLVCFDCIADIQIEVEYHKNEKMPVCKNCYARYRLSTVEDTKL